jgi:DNA-binding MarR family transcriptional regulator
MNNTLTPLEQLIRLGLSGDEARIYLELLREPTTHLKLAHATGINRTKVYRLADDLEKRSLVAKRVDDRGTFLVATDPSQLEIGLIDQEDAIKQKREAFTQLVPMLALFKQPDAKNFVVNTYDGSDGFKQMLWHELKTHGEELILGCGTIEDVVSDAGWAEKHRHMTVEAGYTIREIINVGDKDEPFTANKEFMTRYTHRVIPSDILPLGQQMCIYNDTVAIYHWRHDQKVGLEIISAPFATMMRDVFEMYWQKATPPVVR